VEEKAAHITKESVPRNAALGIFKGLLFTTAAPRTRKVKHKENIPKPPYIAVANHSPTASAAYVALRTLIKFGNHGKKLDRVYAMAIRRRWNKYFPLQPKHMFYHAAGFVYMNPKKGSERLLATCVEVLREHKKVLLIFPEGALAKGALYRGKTGALRIALRAGVPILPIGIKKKGRFFKRFNVKIGAPIVYTREDRARLNDREHLRFLTDQMMMRVAELADLEYLPDVEAHPTPWAIFASLVRGRPSKHRRTVPKPSPQ